MEAFWGHVELKNRLGSSLGALFVLDIDFLTFTPAILEGFGTLWERFWDTFEIFFSSSGITDPLGQILRLGDLFLPFLVNS